MASSSTACAHPSVNPLVAPQQFPSATGAGKPDRIPKRELKAIHCGVWGKKRIEFYYRSGRWTISEALCPWDIREALIVTLERIEQAVPGSLGKAAKLDDENWLANKRRTRRYIAESPELLYIESPHLKNQSAAIAGYHVLTNMPWCDVPSILRLVCQAANIKFGSLSDISL